MFSTVEIEKEFESLANRIKAEYEKYFINAGISFHNNMVLKNGFTTFISLAKNDHEDLWLKRSKDPLYSFFVIHKLGPDKFKIYPGSFSFHVAGITPELEGINIEIPFPVLVGTEEQIINHFSGVCQTATEVIKSNQHRFINSSFNIMEKIR